MAERYCPKFSWRWSMYTDGLGAVAALVAQGLTNRQIAGALVVTERTAEMHLQNILNKLGFTSRAQVAAWATEHGLHAPPQE